jgi:hypothetical protein
MVDGVEKDGKVWVRYRSRPGISIRYVLVCVWDVDMINKGQHGPLVPTRVFSRASVPPVGNIDNVDEVTYAKKNSILLDLQQLNIVLRVVCNALIRQKLYNLEQRCGPTLDAEPTYAACLGT